MDMLIAACSKNKNNGQFFSSRMKSFRQRTCHRIALSQWLRCARGCLLRSQISTMASFDLGVRAMLVFVTSPGVLFVMLVECVWRMY